MDIRSMVQIIRSGKNPEELINNFIQAQLGGTPMGQNLLGLVQSHDTASIEKIARNICQQKGLDFEKEFTAFKQNLGL